MRRVAAGALAAALFAAPAFAVVADIDADGDGLASFAEMVVAYPDLTEDAFADIDTSDDGFVDDEELSTALESGDLTEPEE